MTIKSIFFLPGEDLHLVPDTQSPRLDQILYCEEPTADGGSRFYRFIDEPPVGVTVQFEGNYDKANPRTNGFDVEPNFGVVTVPANLPSPERLLDFLVVATVGDGLTFSLTTHIRIRIHETFRHVWLTPSTLTVHRALDVTSPWVISRFTILAEFSDGSYGDLTNWIPRFSSRDPTDRRFVRTSAQPDSPILSWHALQPGIADIDGQSGRLAAKAEGSATVELITPAFISATAPNAKVQVIGPWSTHSDLLLVEGPGIDHVKDVSNILFLPDGFTADERGDFERLVRQLVHRLRVRRRTRPFDLLRDRINYFCGWIASPEAGVSVLEEVETTTGSKGDVTAECMSTNVPASSVAAEWHAGIPSVNTTRFLLNQRDTAFHIVRGGRPNAARRYTFAWLRLDERDRIAKIDLNDFLVNLKDPKTNAAGVGRVWMRPDPADTDPPRAKDEGLVVFVCRFLPTSSVNNLEGPLGRNLCISLCESYDAKHHVAPNASDGIDLVPDSLPARGSFMLCTISTHELSHSFSLADEYGSDHPGRLASIPPIFLPADKVTGEREHPNVQARADLLTSGSLDADKIKWLWPRVEKAGVLAKQAAPLTVAPFSILLEAGHAAAFMTGDVVRLRTRPLVSAGPPSMRLRVTSIEGEALIVDPEEATVNTAAALASYYVPGSIVMAPKRAPDTSDSLGDDLLLVHESAMTIIDDSHNPMNARFGEAPDRPCHEVLVVNTPTAATNFEPDEPPPKPPRQSGLRVGLYENGDTYDGDIYRPTGMCYMRTSRELTDQDQSGANLTSKDQRMYLRFCPVCRYALVDQLDPTQHGRIDRDYDKIYPR